MIDLSLDRRSAADLQNSMRRLIFDLGKPIDTAILMTAWYVAKAARAATKLSAKTRRVVPNPDYKKVFVKGWYARTQAFKWAVSKYQSDGTVRFVPVKAETEQEAKQSKAAQIRRRGLAQDAWSWISRALGGSAPATRNRTMNSAADVKKQLGVTNPQILLQDNLRYAGLAFRTKGRATQDDIMRRAANSLRATVERKIAGRLK